MDIDDLPDWTFHRKRNEDPTSQEGLKAACSQWWDQLNEEERKRVFVELLVESKPGIAKFIYEWIQDYVRKDRTERLEADKRAVAMRKRREKD